MLTRKKCPLAAPLLCALLSSIAVPGQAQTTANFVTMNPCRIADTRDARYNPYGLGTPSMGAQSSRDFNILGSPCGVPSAAIAYSLNITVVPHGPLPYLTLYPTGQTRPEVSTLNSYSGAVAANGAIVPAGAGGKISVYVEGETDVLIDINGYMTQYVAPTPTTIQQITNQITQSVALPTILAQSNSGSQSVALGNGASSIGTQNTAIGYNALSVTSNGIGNSAMGAGALASNVSGSNNVAIGTGALTTNASGSSNIAIGTNALLNGRITGGNVAIGHQSLFSDTTGQNNTAVGFQSLFTNNGGANNIAIGNLAGYALNNTSNNIEIGNAGTVNDAQTIRIGTQDVHTRAFLAGIRGNGVAGISAGLQLYIDPNGQIGVFSSSRRYKEDIQDIATDGSKFMRLRPVQFRYKQPAADGSKPLQYGLIAEEVNNVYPNLVEHDSAGQIEGVRYQELPALLLQQIQKQQRVIDDLQQRLKALEAASGAPPRH